MKRLKLRKWVKVVLVLGVVALVLNAMAKTDKEGMESCTSAGHSYNYCASAMYR